MLALLFLQSLAELSLPTLMADIVDIGIVNGDTAFILRRGGAMLLAAAGGALCTIWGNLLSAKTATGFGRDLRCRVFTHIESFSLHEFDHIGTASLITRTTNDVTQVQMVLIMILRITITAPLMCIGGVIMAVSRDIELSKVMTVIIPVIAAVMALVAGKALPLFKAMQVKLDRLNLVVRENLTGIRVIRAFNRIEHEQQRFNHANLDLTATAIRVNKILAAIMPILTLSLNFTAIAIIWFGGARIDSGHMQVGDLMAFLQYVMLIMFSLFMVSMMFVMVPRAAASAARINQVLDIVPGVKNAPSAPRLPAAGGRHGSVEFREVTFSYPGAERPALNNISFSAGPGEVTAIIGGTGAGKTTLINLMLRFYDLYHGGIFIDGVEIREMPQEELRKKIGYVPQKSLLFTGTVAENIRFGHDGAADEEVAHAAAVAQATEFIAAMPGGFDAPIAQGGANLSGGQKQRLAIARALVRKPEIYIFDDSFSALDFKTDAAVRAAIKNETREAAVFIVTQRVSTVMDADRIIVLDDGRMAGIGTHKELLAGCEVYREIVYSQLAEEEIA